MTNSNELPTDSDSTTTPDNLNVTVPGDSDTAGSNAQGAPDADGPAGASADAEHAVAGLDPDLAVDDGMGPDAPADVAGEDEAVPGLDDDPLSRAHGA